MYRLEIKILFTPVLQMIAEENQVRLDLQMALDSKDSDIEQLRCQISSLSVHSMDSTSISSGNDLDVGDGYPGRQKRLPLTLIISLVGTNLKVGKSTSLCTSCTFIFPWSLPEFLLFPFVFTLNLFVFQANCF